MSSAGGIGRARQRLRALSDRTPLRIKMITAVLALVIIALGVISFASQAVFREYLTNQAAARLEIYSHHVNDMIAESGQLDGSRFIGDGLELAWVLQSNGQQFSGWHNPVAPPQVPTSQAWVAGNKGNPVTVSGQPGVRWLVIVEPIKAQVGPPDPVTGQVPTAPAILVVGYDLGNVNQSIGYLDDIDLLVSGAVILILAIVGVAADRRQRSP